jgi:hypothetical protein
MKAALYLLKTLALDVAGMIRPPSVDRALSMFSKTLGQLEASVAHHATKADDHEERAGYHDVMRERHMREVSRARRLYDRINRLIEG